MDRVYVIEPLISQMRAALAMLRKAVEACPEELWFDSTPRNAFWHVAYHTVFYAYFYLHPSESEFVPWAGHQPGARLLSRRDASTGEPVAPASPYSRAEVLQYLDLCFDEIGRRLEIDPLEAQSGFSWLPLSRYELHLYNLRHIQHHTGQLADRMRCSAGIGLPWIVDEDAACRGS